MRRLFFIEPLERRLLLAGDRFEPNDSWTSATDLGTLDQTLPDLTIHTPEDEDWFVWTAPTDGTLGIDLLARDPASKWSVSLDSDPQVPGNLGQFGPAADSERISVPVRASQRYWIQVTGGGSAKASYTLAVALADPQPALSRIADQVIVTDTYTRHLPFSTNAFTATADTLSFTVLSSNPALVPVENVVVNGRGTDRTLRVTPAASRSGQAVITITAADGSGRTASHSFTITVEDVADTDGDGLLDRWETEGLDVNNDGIIDLDLPGVWGTDPYRKDLFVEVDSMLGARPYPSALDQVIKAFADAPTKNPDGTTGVRLVIQRDDQAIVPAAPDFTSVANPWRAFEQIKRQYFGTEKERHLDPATNPNREAILQAKRRVFRYCLFATKRGDQPEASGLAELPGNDFMVTLGSWFHRPSLADQASYPGGSPEQQAGTFMHELGHNLGLHHGGGDDINFKPNYFSVMNYNWQVPSRNVGWHLDYSRQKLPTLDESDLDESRGIGFPAGSIHDIEHHETHVGPVPLRRVPLVGAVDWDRDGIVGEEHVTADINRFRWDQNRDGRVDREDQILQPLHGYDDWSNLRFRFRDTDNYSEGVHDCPQGEPDCVPDEYTSTDHAKFYSGLAADGLEINDQHPIATDRGETDDFQDQELSIHTSQDVDWFTWLPVHTGPVEILLSTRQDEQVDLAYEVLEWLGPGLDPLALDPRYPPEQGQPAVYDVESGRRYFVKTYSPGDELGYYGLTVDGPEVWVGDRQGEGDAPVWDDSDHWIIDGARGKGLPTPGDHVTFPVTELDTSALVQLVGEQEVASLTFLDDYELTRGDLTVGSGAITVAPDVSVTMDVDLGGPPDLHVRGGGTLLVQGTARAEIVVEAGVVGGGGSVERLTVTSSGSVSPGQSIGTFSATGSGSGTSVTIDGALRVELDGDQTDLLSAGGSVMLLAGSLRVDAVGRLGPFEFGENTREIVRGSSVAGSFAFLNGHELDDQPLNIHAGHGVFVQGIRYDRESTWQSVLLDLFQAAAGDANGDRAFDQTDMIEVLRGGKYRSGEAASWEEGDWNDDGQFDQFDLIAALRTGAYLAGPYAARAPE